MRRIDLDIFRSLRAMGFGAAMMQAGLGNWRAMAVFTLIALSTWSFLSPEKKVGE